MSFGTGLRGGLGPDIGADAFYHSSLDIGHSFAILSPMNIPCESLKPGDEVFHNRGTLTVARVDESPEGMMVFFEGQRLPLCYSFGTFADIYDECEADILAERRNEEALENRGVDHTTELMEEGWL